MFDVGGTLINALNQSGSGLSGAARQPRGRKRPTARNARTPQWQPRRSRRSFKKPCSVPCTRV